MKRITEDMVKFAEENNIFLIEAPTLKEKADALNNYMSDNEVHMLRFAYLKSKLTALKLY